MCVAGVVRVMPHCTCGIGDALRQRRKRLRRIVAVLHFDRRPIDRGAIEPRRRAGLEPSERKAHPFEGCPTGRCAGASPTRPAGICQFADMDEAAQKRPGGQHDGASAKDAAIRQPHTGDLTTAGHPPAQGRPTSPSMTVKLAVCRKRLLHGGCIKLAVGLGARPAHRWPFAAIEKAELNARRVRHSAHQAIERIDLAHQVAFAEPADGGIAGHGADGGKTMSDEAPSARPCAPPLQRLRSRRGRRRPQSHRNVCPPHLSTAATV